VAIVGRTATVTEVNNTGLSGTITGTLPTGMAYGDVLICAYIGSGSIANHTPPSGWTAFVSPFVVPDAALIAAYWRAHTQANPITVGPSVTYNNSARHTLIVQAYSGVNTTTPIDVTATTAVTAPYNTTLDAPSITTVTANAMIISADLVDSANTLTTKPTSMTLVADASGGGVGRGGALAQELKATAGATGVRTWTAASSLGMGAWMTALRPANMLTLTASATPTGTVRKSATKRLAGSITPVGTWRYLKVVEKLFTATVVPAGALAKRTVKRFTASADPSGALRKSVRKAVFSGSVTPAGAIHRAYARLFSGSATPSGAWSYIELGRVAGRPGVAIIKITKAAEVYLRRRFN
jgi:hypothetical protein